MPAPLANARTRSGSKPGARNHGAMTTRRAPWRRNLPSASVSDRSSWVANAVVAPAHEVPANSFGATLRVRAFAVRSDVPIATTRTPRPSSRRDTPNSVTRRRITDTNRSSSPSTGACHICWAVKQSAIWRGMSTRAWYAFANSNGVTTAGPSTDVSTSARLGELCSRNARRTSRAVRRRVSPPATIRAFAADRGSALPCAVSTSLGACAHEACNPHSVLASPCQRPLRGSVPSTGLAVHGAQPIDGYPS